MLNIPFPHVWSDDYLVVHHPRHIRKTLQFWTFRDRLSGMPESYTLSIVSANLAEFPLLWVCHFFLLFFHEDAKTLISCNFLVSLDACLHASSCSSEQLTEPQLKAPVLVQTVKEIDLGDDDLKSICSYIAFLEAEEYGGPDKARKPLVLFDMIKKCPDFFLIAMDGQQVVGYCDLWQLRPDFYSSLLMGRSHEEEITASHIISQTEPPSNCWYFGSIIIMEKYRAAYTGIHRSVFWQISARMRSLFDDCPGGTRVMAVGSTSFGQDVLRRHGFQAVASMPNPRDSRPRYQKIIEELELV